MFEKRFITEKCSSKIPVYLQNLMWLMIDSMEVKKQDSVQNFELKKIIEEDKFFQQVIHTQKYNQYKNIVIISVDFEKIVDTTVSVVNYEEYSVMDIVD